jgi:hypothetical protein
VDEACAAQHPEMSRHGRPTDRKPGGQLPAVNSRRLSRFRMALRVGSATAPNTLAFGDSRE